MSYEEILSNQHENEPFYGTCPVFCKKAKVVARYSKRKTAKTDIMPTYHYCGPVSCSLLKSPKYCPRIEGCPFPPEYL